MKGIIIADTKFEFGETETGEIILIDEVLTPGTVPPDAVVDEIRRGSGPRMDTQSAKDKSHSINNFCGTG